MDELIYILINAIIGMFSGKQQNAPPPPMPPRRPANAPPPLPGRPAVRPQQPSLQRPPVPAARRPPVSQQRVAGRPVVARPPVVAPPPVKIVQPVAVEAAPPTAHHSFTTINATTIRRLMKPQTLRTQLVMMEILQKPLALRER
jgi:hypothetical protein